MQLNGYAEVNQMKNESKGQFIQKRKHELEAERVLWDLRVTEGNPSEREKYKLSWA